MTGPYGMPISLWAMLCIFGCLATLALVLSFRRGA